MNTQTIKNTALFTFVSICLALLTTVLMLSFDSAVIVFSQAETEDLTVSDRLSDEILTTKDYFFIAEPCDSLTKLVRRALLTYDGANNNIALSKPGIIYAETNIVQNMGAYWLDIGQEVTIDGQAVSDYAANSLALSEEEIAAWAYYVPSVDFEIVDIQVAANEQEVVEEIVDQTAVETTASVDTESTSNYWWIAGIGSVAIVWYLLWKREEQ